MVRKDFNLKGLREKYIFKPMRKESKRILEKDLQLLNDFVYRKGERR